MKDIAILCGGGVKMMQIIYQTQELSNLYVSFMVNSDGLYVLSCNMLLSIIIKWKKNIDDQSLSNMSKGACFSTHVTGVKTC